MARGHVGSLTITMWGTFTPYSLPAFTGAFDLTLKLDQENNDNFSLKA